MSAVCLLKIFPHGLQFLCSTQNLLPNPRAYRYSLMFQRTALYIWVYNTFSVNFCIKLRYVSSFSIIIIIIIILHTDLHFSSAICGKQYPFSIEVPLFLPSQISIDYIPLSIDYTIYTRFGSSSGPFPLPSVYVSACSPKPYCLDHGSFISALEIGSLNPLALLFFNIVLVFLGLCLFI